ncbi:hypothetical protein D9756_009973 [Leucocoprinus leucothites]|uniref:Uncharacterized protein n=1 Tax=Leucocoprinus leucothites TaxID=201217 RepID=A0A8H5CTX2_9AGAR|nr:hypothetical protein D9756_009973 [Leucoagaricus leucothites]
MSSRKTPSLSENDEKSVNLGGKSDAFVSTKEVDTGAELVAGYVGELDPKEGIRIRRKIDKHIIPLMCILYWLVLLLEVGLLSYANL